MELANGHPPHRRSSIKAMFTAAVEGYPQPFEEPARWSAEFAQFLASCLQVNPTARPTCDALLAHPFLSKAASREHMVDVVGSIFNRRKDVIIVSSGEYSSQDS